MGRSSWRAGGALLLFLCIAVAGTAALAQDEIVISPGPGTLQITAGDGGGTIEVAVTNTSVSVDKVTFAYLNASTDPSGALSVTSDSAKPFQTTFSSTKAGDAIIGITIDCHDNSASMSTSFEYPVRVIPADPYAYISRTYDQTVPVGGNTDIVVRMKDVYGNVINDETEVEIDFIIGENSVRQGFDSNGNCTVTFTASTKTGHVLIGIYPVIDSSNLDRLMDIEVVSLREPYSIEFYNIVTAPGEPYPVDLQCLAGTTYYFDVGIRVRDFYENPITDYPVAFTTSIGGSQTIITSYEGIAHAKVGPQKSIGEVEISAEVEGLDPITETLIFTGGVAKGLEISVNPADIPSYEVDPTVKATIYARVHNALGTGVAGETVSFRILDNTITNNTPMNPPLLTATSAVTDADGYATVQLQAGTFPEYGAADFYHSAMGSCQVEVTWEGSSRISPNVTWRNYPFLRVETDVSDTVIAPGETIDVTIHLIGDGNELLAHRPISVVLCLDRGEDMLLNEGKTGKDRMELARVAAMSLVEGDIQLNPGNTSENDYVALISYSDNLTGSDLFPGARARILGLPTSYNWANDVGKDGNPNGDEVYIDENYPGHNITPYGDFATIDAPFTGASNWIYLSNALNNTVPVKKDDTGQASAPIRYALKESIEYLDDSPAEGGVKAIVLLMQNNYRYFGDPFAEGAVLDVAPDSNTLPKGGAAYEPFGFANSSYENMATYAVANGIKIYAIYYPTGGSVTDEDVPKRLASETGGEYYFAADYGALTEAFERIKEKLLQDAGLDTKVYLNFAEVPEDFSYTSTQLLDYKAPTHIDFYNWSGNPYVAVDHLPTYPKDVDQTAMWLGTAPGSSAGTLDFDVGNISVKQTWMTQFSFTVNDTISEPLNFSLFGGNSRITFEGEDGETIEQFLPPITVTVIPGLTPEALFNATIGVGPLDWTDYDESFAYFDWPIDYTGSFPIKEEFFIRKTVGEDTSWKKVGSLTVPMTCTGDDLSLYTVDLESGVYEAKIRVSTADAGYDEAVRLFGIDLLEEEYILLT